jgi:hypothetical protein
VTGVGTGCLPRKRLLNRARIACRMRHLLQNSRETQRGGSGH